MNKGKVVIGDHVDRWIGIKAELNLSFHNEFVGVLLASQVLAHCVELSTVSSLNKS